MLLLRKYWADFNETWFKIFLEVWGILVVVVRAYIAYISKAMTAYIFPYEYLRLHLCCHNMIMTS